MGTKYPYKSLEPKYLRRIDDTLKHHLKGQTTYRGKRYAIHYIFGYGPRDGSEHRAARGMSTEIKDYSPFGSAVFKVDDRWVVGVRQWKQ
jgi:hypothetical protein